MKKKKKNLKINLKQVIPFCFHKHLLRVKNTCCTPGAAKPTSAHGKATFVSIPMGTSHKATSAVGHVDSPTAYRELKGRTSFYRNFLQLEQG